MGLPPPTRDPAAVRELADAILAEPRFDVGGESLAERVQRWFAEQVAALLSQLAGTGAGALLAWLVVLGAVAAVVYLVLRHGRRPVRRRPATTVAEVMVELRRTPDEWRAEAEALEAAGRWREGLRCRHRGLVGALVRRGVIRERAGRTAGEHLRDVACALPEAAVPMAAATELFEAAWYGSAATARAEAERFVALETEVLSGRAGTAPSGR